MGLENEVQYSQIMYFKQEQKLSFEVVVLEYRLWCLINGKTILNASGLLIF